MPSRKPFAFRKKSKVTYFGWTEIVDLNHTVQQYDLICRDGVDPNKALADMRTDDWRPPVFREGGADAWKPFRRYNGRRVGSLTRYMIYRNRWGVAGSPYRTARYWSQNKYKANPIPLNPMFSRRLPLP